MASAFEFKSIWRVEIESKGPWSTDIVKKYFLTEDLANQYISTVKDGGRWWEKVTSQPQPRRELAIFIGEDVIPLGAPVIINQGVDPDTQKVGEYGIKMNK